MKTYGKESFLPYPMEILEEVMKEPVKLDPVPMSEKAEIDAETPFKWTYTLCREPYSDVIYDCEASYDEKAKQLYITMTSRTKKMPDHCIINLYKVGEYRTRMYVKYEIAYNMLKLSHVLARMRVARTGHKAFVDAIFHVIDRINSCAAEISNAEN